MLISLSANTITTTDFMLYTTLAIILLIAYLLGSLSFGLISSKLFKLPDPRSFGSKNIGATNILRSGNKMAAIVTLLGDALKGGLAILCAQFILNLMFTETAINEYANYGFTFLAGLAAFLGHLYPITLKFKGGKGVATAMGVLLFLLPKLALVLIVIWLLTIYITKYSSLAALFAASSCILLTLLNSHTQFITLFKPLNTVQQLCIITMSAMLIYKHKANIIRLIQGSEPKIGQKNT